MGAKWYQSLGNFVTGVVTGSSTGDKVADTFTSITQGVVGSLYKPKTNGDSSSSGQSVTLPNYGNVVTAVPVSGGMSKSSMIALGIAGVAVLGMMFYMVAKK